MAYRLVAMALVALVLLGAHLFASFLSHQVGPGLFEVRAHISL